MVLTSPRRHQRSAFLRSPLHLPAVTRFINQFVRGLTFYNIGNLTPPVAAPGAALTWNTTCFARMAVHQDRSRYQHLPDYWPPLQALGLGS